MHSSLPLVRSPKHESRLHLVPVHWRSEASVQKGGSRVQVIGGQQVAPLQGKLHWSAGSGVSPESHLPRALTSVQAGAGPPQQGRTHTCPPGHVSDSVQATAPPVVALVVDSPVAVAVAVAAEVEDAESVADVAAVDAVVDAASVAAVEGPSSARQPRARRRRRSAAERGIGRA